MCEELGLVEVFHRSGARKAGPQPAVEGWRWFITTGADVSEMESLHLYRRAISPVAVPFVLLPRPGPRGVIAWVERPKGVVLPVVVFALLSATVASLAFWAYRAGAPARVLIGAVALVLSAGMLSSIAFFLADLTRSLCLCLDSGTVELWSEARGFRFGERQWAVEQFQFIVRPVSLNVMELHRWRGFGLVGIGDANSSFAIGVCADAANVQRMVALAGIPADIVSYELLGPAIMARGFRPYHLGRSSSDVANPDDIAHGPGVAGDATGANGNLNGNRE